MFIVRDSSFISRLPVDLSLKYTSLKKDKKRMDILKSNIQQKYPVSNYNHICTCQIYVRTCTNDSTPCNLMIFMQDQVFNYSVNTAYSNMTGEVKFSGFENYLSKLREIDVIK